MNPGPTLETPRVAVGGTQVFLVGAARSGTSLVYKALCLHPETGYLSNWSRRFPSVPVVSAANRIARRAPTTRNAVWFADGSNAYVYGRRRTLLERSFPMPIEGEPLFGRCGLHRVEPDEGPPPEDEVIGRLRSALTRHLRWAGGRVLVSKCVSNNRHVGLLRRAFPGARFVSIVRDGRAVAASLSRVDWWPNDVLWWLGDTPAAWERRGGDPIELCARNWVEDVRVIEQGLEEVPPEQVMRLRYEDLVDRPLDTLRAVGRFAGLDDDPRWLAELASMSFPNRTERWVEVLDATALATVQRVQADELVRYGYVLR